MKKAIITLCLVLALATPAHAGEWFSWDETNTKLHVPLVLSLLSDMKTTEWHIKNGNQPNYVYSESNYFLGNNPSIEETREYFAWVAISSTAITFILPPLPSYIFQGGVISVEFYYTNRNVQAGASLKF